MEGTAPKRKLPAYLIRRMINKNTPILLVCIFLAAIFWILIALSKDYAADIQVDVTYSGIPADKVLVNNLPEKFQLKVKASGWHLLREYFDLESFDLSINVGRYAETKSIITNANLDYFSTQLPPNVGILLIYPGVVNFNFDNRAEKKVPVRPRSDITLNPQFGFTDPLSVSPDSVKISGPASVIDTIHAVATAIIELNDLAENKSGKVSLEVPAISSLNYDLQEVSFHVQVEKFTELQVEVPVQLINTVDKQVILVNKSVIVSFRIPLSKMDVAESDDFATLFEVRADLSTIKPGDKVIPLEIVHHPEYVKNIALNPRTVQFLFVNL